ncbi:MAG: cysteine desulfurase [Waddliaceae bacterium]|nr:cysteine desulfurase [Waddliaceae bacterium]MBT3579343.1 cysteine desulfurase [Waddliaceae bacterium]MBT4444833.1 cysteine desulfurase [Waddliaceae bacterium]MBT7264293.1 cysteine desulfurase [Waddliaceae bacterium]MBT7461201.1 cysteine desulfurase [Waddliaceae bacterium]
MNDAIDFIAVRDGFPMLKSTMHGKPLVYLDSAATTHKPEKVISAMSDFYRNEYATVHRAIYELSLHATERYNAVRGVVKNFINAPSENTIVFTRGTTESINLVASSFGKSFITTGDEVVISEIEHHSNIVPWQLMCEERGAVLRVIPVDDNGEIIIEEYRKMLGAKTKLVAICHVANSIGTVLHVKEMVSMAHDVGAKTLVDGAQAAPHYPIDVQDLDADFYAFSGHKVYGPTGIGILYGKKELLEALPPYHGGGDMVDIVTMAKTTYQQPPLKFEAGTPMIAEVIGLGAALEYVMDKGIETIHSYEEKLLGYALDCFDNSGIDGLKVLGPCKARRSGIVSFIVDGIHSLDIGTMLDFKGVAIRTGHHCAQPTMERFGVTSTARMSLGIYNNESDIDIFFEGLKEVVAKLR